MSLLERRRRLRFPARTNGFGGRCRRLAMTCAIAASLAFAVTGCNPISSAENDFNAAIAALQNQSADWQAIIPNLESKLTADGSNLVSQVDSVMQSGLHQINAGSKCDLDFIGVRLKEQLSNLRIIDFLLKEPLTRPSPFACYSAPAVVSEDDINSGKLKVVEVDGFDFNPSALDQRLPSVATHAKIVAGGQSIEIPADHVTTQLYSVFVTVDKNANFSFPPNATQLVLSWDGVNATFPIPITPPTPPPPAPVTVTGMTAQFDNLDDGKDHDSILTVNVGQGKFSYAQPLGSSLTFNEWTTTQEYLSSPATVDFNSLSNTPVEVCIAPNGNDTWRFNLHINGTLSNGQRFSVSFPSQELSEDSSNRCTPHLQMPATISTAAAPAGGAVSGGTVSGGAVSGGRGGCDLFTRKESRNLGGTNFNPYMRPVCR